MNVLHLVSIKVRNFFLGNPPKTRILQRLNPDIEKDKKIKETAEYYSALEGQISNMKSKEKQIDFEKENFEQEVELIKEIKKESNKIKKEEYGGAYDLNKIFNLSNSKLGIKNNYSIKITDKDFKKVFDKFKSFVIMPDGNSIGIRGQSGRIWIYGNSPNSIIYKPESLVNYVKMKRIPLACDGNLNRVPDLEKLYLGEIKYSTKKNEQGLEEDEYRESEKLSPVKQQIMNQAKKIYQLGLDKEYLEKLNLLQHQEIQQIERSFEIFKSQANIHNSDLSNAISGLIEQTKSVGKVYGANITLNQQKVLADDRYDKLDESNQELLKETEEAFGKTSQRRAKDELQSDVMFADKYGKKTIINPLPEPQIIKEGQPLPK